MTFTMTSDRITQAYKAIHELTSVPFPYSTARALMALKRRLKEEFEVVASMEDNLLASCHGTATPQGKFRFPTSEDAEAFADAHRELFAQQVDIELPTVDLSPFTSMFRITPGAVEALDGIVIFEKEDEHGGPD